jgi:hypothetical protein
VCTQVVHLSGIEHGYVRKYGYDDGMRMMNLTSQKALHDTESRLAREPTAKASLALWARTVALIPFYGGSFGVCAIRIVSLNDHGCFDPGVVTAAAALKERGRTRVNETAPGTGNAHTLASRDLKLVQLEAVVMSILSIFCTVQNILLFFTCGI